VKSLAVVIIFFLLQLCFKTQAQPYTQNFNVTSCDRNNLTNQCWQFASMSIDGAGALEGTCSVRSSQLNNSLLNQYTLRSPVLKITNGTTMSFTHRVTNTSSNPTLTVTVVEYLTNIETTIYPTFTYPSSSIINTSISFTIPSGLYRIVFKPSGSGGGSRFLMDNLVVNNSFAAMSGPTCTVSLAAITFKNFTAQINNTNTILNWQMANTEAKEFVVEKSFDNISFFAIATIPGNSLTNLTFTHSNFNLSAHYRIKAISFTGNVTYSAVKSVTNNNKNNIVCYPNPVQNQLIITNLPANSNHAIKIFSLNGQVVTNSTITGNQATIAVGNLQTGVYFVEVRNAQGLLLTRKQITKQ
jgi:hypothetical protein